MNNDGDISGKIIRGFQVQKPIGQGKFSIVYKATNLSDNSQVALKMIRIFDMMDPKQREKCLKEVRLLESLDHQNIIKYLDSFIESNQLFIAIEWAEKGDLKKLIKKCQADELPLDEKKIWEYLYQIASALKHMQEKRIMHRDLKPANIFLVTDGTLKLGDLGLGRFMSSQTIEAFSRVGTPLYMSPEVLKGSGYDWKSDVWSLGCIVYELACFRSPFKKDEEKMSPYDLFQTISKGEFPPLPTRYSEELKQIVASMIQVSPQNRLAIDQVVELCEIQLKANVKKHKIDPYLIMDDIAEKLKLLDYEERFCKMVNRKPLTRIYFVQEIDRVEQLRCFFDLCTWIISLRNPSQNPVYLGVRTDPDRIVTTILTNCKTLGVKFQDFVTAENLKLGFGEAVCFIVNDLLNKELIRQDYRFQTPVLIENGVECYGDPPETFDFFEEMPPGDPQLLINSKKEIFEAEIEEKPEDEVEELGINPEDWRKEVERVEKKLIFEEDEEKSNSLKDICRKIGELNKSGILMALERKMNIVSEEIERIREGEKRLQRGFAKEIEEGKEVLDAAREISSPKRKESSESFSRRNSSIGSQRRDSVGSAKRSSVSPGKKGKVVERFNYKKERIEEMKKELERIDEEMARLKSGKKKESNPVPILKAKMGIIRKELRSLDLAVGILRNKHQ